MSFWNKREQRIVKNSFKIRNTTIIKYSSQANFGKLNLTYLATLILLQKSDVLAFLSHDPTKPNIILRTDHQNFSIQ